MDSNRVSVFTSDCVAKTSFVHRNELNISCFSWNVKFLSHHPIQNLWLDLVTSIGRLKKSFFWRAKIKMLFYLFLKYLCAFSVQLERREIVMGEILLIGEKVSHVRAFETRIHLVRAISLHIKIQGLSECLYFII